MTRQLLEEIGFKEAARAEHHLGHRGGPEAQVAWSSVLASLEQFEKREGPKAEPAHLPEPALARHAAEEEDGPGAGPA